MHNRELEEPYKKIFEILKYEQSINGLNKEHREILRKLTKPNKFNKIYCSKCNDKFIISPSKKWFNGRIWRYPTRIWVCKQCQVKTG